MDFSELARSRYSVRSFQDRPLSQAHLDLILEAGRLAPTAHNNQPQRIFVAKSKDALDKLASVCRCTFGAPTILVVGYDETRERKSRLDPSLRFGVMDSSIVCTHMMLQAHDIGVGSCWVGLFLPQDVSRVLELPEEVRVTALLLLGYPAEDAEPLHLHYSYRDRAQTITELP